jgi:tRNA 2-thiouridine synthesizing protein A
MEPALTNPISHDRILDCRGTLCPMPVIRLRQTLDAMEPGQVVRVLATDPASTGDMPAFARNTGHELLHASADNGIFEYLFRKTAS